MLSLFELPWAEEQLNRLNGPWVYTHYLQRNTFNSYFSLEQPERPGVPIQTLPAEKSKLREFQKGITPDMLLLNETQEYILK